MRAKAFTQGPAIPSDDGWGVFLTLKTTIPSDTQQHSPLLTQREVDLECPAYGRAFKCLAAALLLAAGLWLLQLQRLTPSAASEEVAIIWLWLPWAMMAYTSWFVLSGTTRLTHVAIEQSWMWPKRLELRNMAYAKLIRVRGFEWLIAPRLYTKSFSGKLLVFYASDRTMLDAFKELENAIATQQAQR
jgi:hypothetical protein